MTTRWRPEFDPEHLYFVTATTEKRTNVFQRDVVKRILVDGLYYVSLMNKVQLYAFVVMPNHVHAIIQCPSDFWSSARYYLREEPCIIPIRDVCELLG